ncbi:MAG: TlpA family protein disulfide reductase [Deltaproteobacteria bacterium]|nr:TlpA family protein disulfide reductase [Deltaproteobacteria bacterium]
MNRSLLLVLALCAGCATTASTGAVADSTPAANATALPDFALNTVDGETVHLSDYLGKGVIVLSFWATWCEPCKTELPHLQELYAKHKGQGLTVLALAMDDPTTMSQVAAFAHRSGFTFPVLLDSETKAAALYNRQKNAPYTVVIDRGGHIHSEKAGYEPGAEKALEAELETLLATTPPAAAP